MKKMKKFASLLMAVAMIFSMMSTAFADEPTPSASVTSGEAKDTLGSIAIGEPAANETYTLYRILTLESFDTEAKTYVYKASSDQWKAWLDTQKAYVSVDASGYVTWAGQQSDAAAFAEAAMAFIEAANNDDDATNDIAPANMKYEISGTALNAANAEPAVITADEDGSSIKFSGLLLGYYLVDSTKGALCALNTTAPDISVTEKNSSTEIDKKVKNEAGIYVEYTSAEVGQVVEFATRVDVYPGGTNYIYHDRMSAGLTYINEIQDPNNTPEDKTDDLDYTTKIYFTPMANNNLVAATNYSIVRNSCPKDVNNGCDFDIVFKQSFLDSITEYTPLTIVYYAVVNKDAVIYHDSANENENEAKVTYGNNSSTEWNDAKVYSYMFELVKVDENDKILAGAKFALYDVETGGTPIPMVKDGVKDKVTIYRIASEDEIADTDVTKYTEFEVGSDAAEGRVIIKGVALKKYYYLQETDAPNGYTMLNSRVKVMVAQAKPVSTVEADTKVYVEYAGGSSDHMATINIEGLWEKGGVVVENIAGQILPSTGGMGTTIFYVSGAALALGAIVLFITKRRMEA